MALNQYTGEKVAITDFYRGHKREKFKMNDSEETAMWVCQDHVYISSYISTKYTLIQPALSFKGQ